MKNTCRCRAKSLLGLEQNTVHSIYCRYWKLGIIYKSKYIICFSINVQLQRLRFRRPVNSINPLHLSPHNTYKLYSSKLYFVSWKLKQDTSAANYLLLITLFLQFLHSSPHCCQTRHPSYLYISYCLMVYFSYLQSTTQVYHNAIPSPTAQQTLSLRHSHLEQRFFSHDQLHVCKG